MKNALKHFKVWLFTAIMSVVGIGVPFLVTFITSEIPNVPVVQYPVLHGVFGAIYLLVGFIWGDLYVANWRRKTKNWDDKLPDDIKEKAWIRHWPFYLAAATVFLVFISFEIVFWITGGYPFL